MRGLERDRAADETGHQIAVLGRIGSRAFTLDEMKELNGNPWYVTDDFDGPRASARSQRTGGKTDVGPAARRERKPPQH